MSIYLVQVAVRSLFHGSAGPEEVNSRPRAPEFCNGPTSEAGVSGPPWPLDMKYDMMRYEFHTAVTSRHPHESG